MDIQEEDLEGIRHSKSSRQTMHNERLPVSWMCCVCLVAPLCRILPSPCLVLCCGVSVICAFYVCVSSLLYYASVSVFLLALLLMSLSLADACAMSLSRSWFVRSFVSFVLCI